MQNGTSQKKTEWLSPSVLLSVLGMLGMAFASYQAFQQNAREEIAKLNYRVEALEKERDEVKDRMRDRDRFQSQTELRLDRLERGR